MSGGSKKSGPREIPSEATRLEDPIVFYHQQVGRYPSNAQVWWAYKRAPEPGTVDPPKLYLEVFDPALRHQMASGNTQVSKGHYILQAFNQDRSAASAVPGIPVQRTSHRPSVVVFFAGRAFYTGVNQAGYSTKVYFTQILENIQQVQLCYQAQDPTSEDLRDLLPSDGGVIIIPTMAEAVHAMVMGQSLFIFATNGVWQIQGSEGIGFQANDYSVQKVSSVGVQSNVSFVEAGGSPLWWNDVGIWTMQVDQLGSAQVQSVSDDKIRSFIQSLPTNSRHHAKGAYDSREGVIQWLFRSTAANTEEENFEYDSILNLDTKTGAFYVYTPSNPDVKFRGIAALSGHSTIFDQVPVVVEGVQVTVEGLDVTVGDVTQTLIDDRFKYLVEIESQGISFAEEFRPELRDWISVNGGTSYPSFFRAGYSVLGESDKKFQSNHVTVNYVSDISGSAFLSGSWDYTTDPSSNRWSTKQQVYRHNGVGFQYSSSKLKVRGHGKALQINVYSDGDKPFEINGWAINATGNTMA